MWMPIETAPKNTRCLVWIDLRGEHVNDRSYAMIAVRDDEFWRNGHSGDRLGLKPTHWMPLPLSPSAVRASH